LNPGSYLRISENTEVVFLDTSLDNLKIELLRGAAIVEVAVAEREQGAIASIITPQAEFRIAKGGLYRFDVDAAKTIAVVRKGKLVVPQPDARPTKNSEWVAVSNGQSRTMVVGTAVKEGKKIIIEGGQTSIVAVGKKEEDGFDMWSRDRAQSLIAANKRLMNRGIIASAIQRRMITRWDSPWGIGNGFWIYNPYSGCYTFVPAWFGYSSPYGWGYGYCGCPTYYYPRNGGGWTGGGNTGGSGGWTGGGGSTGGTTGGSKPGGSTGGSVGGFGDRGGSIGGVGTGRGGSASGRGGSRPNNN
ncbi:MAG TPA: FecR domain-containing protein, partial [Blastocatellia bacterium]